MAIGLMTLPLPSSSGLIVRGVRHVAGDHMRLALIHAALRDVGLKHENIGDLHGGYSSLAKSIDSPSLRPIMLMLRVIRLSVVFWRPSTRDSQY